MCGYKTIVPNIGVIISEPLSSLGCVGLPLCIFIFKGKDSFKQPSILSILRSGNN